MTRLKVAPARGAPDYDLLEFANYLGDAISDGEVRDITSTRFKLLFDGDVSIIAGSGFNFPQNGLASGTVKSWTLFTRSQKVLTITTDGLSLRDVDAASQKNERPGSPALEKFLMSLDWTYIGTSANDVAPAGSRVGDNVLFNTIGDDIFRLRGGDDDVFSGNGDDILDGGSGNDRLNGGRGADILKGGAGDDVLIGGGGGDRLEGGRGNDLLLGKGGGDVFVQRTGFGDDEIRGFGGADVVDLSRHNAVSNFRELKAAATDTRAGLEIDLGADTLFFKRLDLEDLSRDDFMF